MARQELARTTRVFAVACAAVVMILPATAEARYAQRTLKTGSHGGDVKLFQQYLKRAGFRVTADGHYGAGTRTAERRFERQAKRRVDGRASRQEQRLVRTAARNAAAGGSASTGGAAYQPPAADPTARAVISADGRTAIAPDGAPKQVVNAIAAANAITKKPYRYGGGHGSFKDSGYDCSGAVSYALHGGGLLRSPLDSSSFMSWGAKGRGKWITVYANSGHAYTVIAGLRFDTSAAGAGGGSGPRWRSKARSSSSYVARHPAGF
jgi:peptidoglycan hydrolase-like protein with peptidoglycan-binding domain